MSGEQLRTVLEYIHGRPVRAALAAVPTEYAWSSVHNYERTARVLIEIDTQW